MNFLSYKGLKQQNICTTFDFRSKIFGLFCTYFDFCFVLCSLIRTFERCSKVLSLETAKINRDLFGSLLAYSYLCKRSLEHTSEEDRCDFVGKI